MGVFAYAAIIAAVAVPVGWVFAAILHELRVIADRLDTRTPGGIRDLLDWLDDTGHPHES